MDLSADPRLTEDISLAEILKLDSDKCKVSDKVKDDIKLLKQMVSLLDKPLNSENRAFDPKCYNKGWEVLQNIVRRLPEAEEALFVKH